MRKVRSEIIGETLKLYVADASYEISINEIHPNCRNDLLLFAIKQKVTNATGGKDEEEAKKIASEIIEQAPSGISKEAKSVAKAFDQLSAEQKEQILALLQSGFGGRQ